MVKNIHSINDFKQILNEGSNKIQGSDKIFFTTNSKLMCKTCARRNSKLICSAINKPGSNENYEIDGSVIIYYEDKIPCSFCQKIIYVPTPEKGLKHV